MKRSTKLILVLAGLCLVAGGGLLWNRHHHPQGSQAQPAAVEYTCAMHTFISKDSPGACPVCGMDLVKRSAAEAAANSPRLEEHVYLSPSQQVMANLDVTSVMYKPLFKEIDAAGVIAYDQSRQGKASAWVAGRVERLYADSVGAEVATDRPIAELSSPELLSAEEEYLALYREAAPQDKADRAAGSGSPLYRVRQRLRQLGFTDAEFRSLEHSGKPDVRIPGYPSVSGTGVAKEVQEGQFVKAGDTLVAVADLSRVWAELDVYEDEFSFLKAGSSVVLLTRAYPGREFSGTITYIYPYVEPKTRTVRVRVVIPNKTRLLKPDMLVQARIQIPLGTDLAVPAESVIVTGSRSLVWVQTKQGVFVPREIRTGVRFRNDVQVLQGLQKNEVIAANGAYLVDSEARLGMGGRPITAATPTGRESGAGSAAKAAALHPGQKKDDMDMSGMTMDPTPSGDKNGKPVSAH